MSKRKEVNTSCTLRVKDTQNNHRISSYLVNTIGKMVSEKELEFIRSGAKNIHDVVLSLGIPSKGEDPHGYEIAYSVVDYLSGNYVMKDSYREVVFDNYMDIEFLFNTHTKMNDFLSFMMNHLLDYENDKHLPVVIHDTYVIIELGYLLLVLQEYMIETFFANKNEVHSYLSDNYLNNEKLSFLVNCIWGDKYALTGIPICTMLSSRGTKASKKLVPNETDKFSKARGYVDSVYEDLDNKKYYFRGVTLSEPRLQKRLDDMHNLGIEHAFNPALYGRFIHRLIQSELTQIHFGRKAIDALKKDKSIIRFSKF